MNMRKIFSIFAAVLFAGSMMAADVTTTYVFQSKEWKAKVGTEDANWVSGKAGAGFNNDGVQVTTAADGANATSPESFENISKIVITYNTNKSAGKGTFDVQVGENKAESKEWKYSGSADGRTAKFTVTYEYATPQSGAVKLTVNTTTNSAYVVSVAITHEESAPSSVAKPTFNLVGGTYHEKESIELTCETADATIYYTLDGSTPTSASTKYEAASPIKLDADGTYTIKAIAIKDAEQSAVAIATYIIAIPKVYDSMAKLVSESVASGTLVSVAIDQTITGIYTNGQGKRQGVFVDEVDVDDKDLEIYYKNAEVPAAWWLGGKISGTILGTWTKFGDDDQWELVPLADDWKWTDLTYAAPTVEAPRYAPAEEVFFGELEVTLTSATEGAEIRYTLDNSAPTETSAKYEAPIKLTASTKMRAIAIKDANKSVVSFKEYKLGTTLTCALAADTASKVSKDNEYVNKGEIFAATGFVTAIQNNWASGTITFWMDDAEGVKKTLEAYKCAVAKEEDAPVVGDSVRVIGKLTKYGTTYEFASGCTCVILKKATPAVNLGVKTIAEFLELKNNKDTCVLTGVVSDIQMDKDDPTKYNKYGNFTLTDESGAVAIYGLLTAAGESKKFIEMGIHKDYKITVKAVYSENNGNPQAVNAVFVAIVETPTAIDNAATENKAIKLIENGQIVIIKNGVRYNALGIRL